MKRSIVGALLLSGTVLTQMANAADMVTPVVPEAKVIETPGGWTFAFSPYFWAAGLSGKTSQFGLPAVNIHSNFSDIWDNLDFAAMAIGEARYGRYSFFGDLLYTKISTGSATPRGILANSVAVKSETFAGTFGAGYSLLQSGPSHLDIVGGVRVWSVNSHLSFDGGVLDGVSRGDHATWVDGIAGLRGNYFITPHVYLTAWGLVGAGQAKIDWDVAGGLGYKFNDRISALAGYRALGVNYSHDGFSFDAVQQGPILGMVVHF